MNQVGGGAHKTSMACHYLVTAFLPLPRVSDERTVDERVLRLPEGATCQRVAVAMAAVIGERVNVETFAARKVDGGVSIRVELRRAPESGLYVSCRVEYELGPLQERIDAMTLAMAAQSPDWPPARHLLRALISASIQLTREQEASSALEPILPLLQAAMTVESELMLGVSGALFAVMVQGDLPTQ